MKCETNSCFSLLRLWGVNRTNQNMRRPILWQNRISEKNHNSHRYRADEWAGGGRRLCSFFYLSTVNWGGSEAFSGPRWLNQNPQTTSRPGVNPPRPLNRVLIATLGLLFSHEDEVQRLFSSAASYDPWMWFPPFAFRLQPSGCASSLWCGKMSWAYCSHLRGCVD